MGTEQWRPLVSSIWPADQVDNVLAVMDCESGGNPNARALTAREDSRGLMQINTYAHQVAGDLFDPETNLRYAYQLWQSSGWGPWSCATALSGGAPSTPSFLGQALDPQPSTLLWLGAAALVALLVLD